MAAPPRIVSLNLGSQSLGLATFQSQAPDRLILTSYLRHDFPTDPAGEGDRCTLITAALRGMMEEIGVKGGPVAYAVSGHSVFARFLKLPFSDEEKLDRIIAFEAQQNIPFPIDEVVWDYQLLGSDSDREIEVVLAAIKSDQLEKINAAVEEAGLETTLVDAAPMALYNAFRFNYSDLSGCSLLLDLGARTTNLLLVEPGTSFSRSIPIGGSSITCAIAREFNEPYAVAELRKTRDGLVRQDNVSAAASDPQVARVSQLLRNTMMRLSSEIARTISFYRAQQQGAPPERIFLCGGTAATPDLREFFVQKFQLPIELFNPLRNVAIASAVTMENAEGSAHLLGELVGLALRATMTCPMELNLRPREVVRRQRLAERRPFLLLAAACFLLGLLGWGFYFMRSASVQAAATNQLQGEVDRLRDLGNQVAKSQKEMHALDAVAMPLLETLNGRDGWLQILEDLNTRLPKENIWITELAPTSNGRTLWETGADATVRPQQISSAESAHGRVPVSAKAEPSRPVIDGVFVRGLYLSNPRQQEVVTDYFQNLLDSQVFVVEAKNQSQVVKPSTPTDTEWAYPYELRLKLRAPLYLP